MGGIGNIARRADLVRFLMSASIASDAGRVLCIGLVRLVAITCQLMWEAAIHAYMKRCMFQHYKQIASLKTIFLPAQTSM